ncbi:AMP-binding protein [Streptomyces yunnanensis]|uniref:AMP-binding protein n=1 Tax=Streptomyces yunnanensis TaxID=156453 RepID=A0ABY8AKN8_9ACTN|nr:AMP-binding protein [Streptomyces yunnanensis]WEB45590.1 AMP-binding protein [Streptomyces yunnanensis]
MRPVPPGAKGEVYVGGVCLAHGYRNRPDLTEQRFVPHPSGEPGARLYRAGKAPTRSSRRSSSGARRPWTWTRCGPACAGRCRTT